VLSPLDFFQLYFTPGSVDDIVQHTNAYAYVKITKENSTKHCNTESNGRWHDTTPDEILRLIGLLIYFGLVDVKGAQICIGAQLLCSMASEQDLSCHGHKFCNVAGFVDFLKGRFKPLYHPTQHVTIDEHMVKSQAQIRH